MSIVTLATNVPGWVGNGERWAVPLTTIWTPPAGCPAVVSREPGVTVALADPSIRCYPPSYNEVWVFSGYYSPGLCMSGYTIACWATTTVLNQELIQPGETAAICVPRCVKVPVYDGLCFCIARTDVTPQLLHLPLPSISRYALRPVRWRLRPGVPDPLEELRLGPLHCGR